MNVFSTTLAGNQVRILSAGVFYADSSVSSARLRLSVPSGDSLGYVDIVRDTDAVSDYNPNRDVDYFGLKLELGIGDLVIFKFLGIGLGIRLKLSLSVNWLI